MGWKAFAVMVAAMLGIVLWGVWDWASEKAMSIVDDVSQGLR